MKNWIIVFALLAAAHAEAAHLDKVIASVEGATGTEEDFMAGVTWSENPEPAYYQCKERLPEPTLELWVGAQSLVRARDNEDQPLLYGTRGPIQVMSYLNKDRKPFLAAYLILPSGETHIFRVNQELRIVKASKQWHCERKEWRTP